MNEKMCKLLKIAQDIWAVLPSLPSRERGLKSKIFNGIVYLLIVAPLAGAWIEIILISIFRKHCTVAPLAGAWIEILLIKVDYQNLFRRPPHRSVD